ncbi:MAG: hypothetical protein ABL925_14250 [Methylococcales bacterium]
MHKVFYLLALLTVAMSFSNFASAEDDDYYDDDDGYAYSHRR